LTRRRGFPIHVGTVLDQQYQREITLADGTDIVQAKGPFVESLTNTNTNKTITDYELGSQTVTTYPDGSGRGEFWGHHGFYFYPVDQTPTGPGLFYGTGHAVVTNDPSLNVLSFSFTGPLRNMCNLLK
jgi:hypothetical protein